MRYYFTNEQEQIVRELINLPGDGRKEAKSHNLSLPIPDVARALNLPPLPHSDLLGSQSWIAGGTVLRWLCGTLNGWKANRPDIDFYFPSIEALNHTACAMLEEGYSFERLYCWQLRATSHDANKAQQSRELAIDDVRRTTLLDWLRNLRNWRNDDRSSEQRIEFEPLTIEAVEQKRVVAVEFQAPLGDILQLVTVVFRPTPKDLFSTFDFSICQFAVDDRFLYFGEYAWNDLFRNRFRLGHINYPPATLWRLIKYVRRGFYPYPKDFFNIIRAPVIWGLNNDQPPQNG